MPFFSLFLRARDFINRARQGRRCEHQWTERVIVKNNDSGSYRQARCARCGEIRVYSDDEARVG